jgi:serine phosphatase RsbU (regulator of sigma subunit)
LTEQVATSARQVAFGVTLLLSMAAAVGGWWLARLLVLPLSRLVAGVGRISEGTRPVSLFLRGPAEVEELAAAVQTMADKLDEQMEEVKQRRDQHRAVAEKLQRALQVTPGVFAGVDLAQVYQSASELAELGGDFYDVFRMSDGRIGVLIGDVSGKGLDAAAQAILMRTSLRPFTYYTDSPAEVLARMNTLLLDMSTVGFVTAFFGILDPQSGELVYSLAGHPPALLVAHTGLSLLDTASPVLGVFPDARFKETTAQLDGGETLVLYTDGLTEARRNGDFFGESRLHERVRLLAALPPRDLTQSLYAQVLDFAGGRLADDLAVLAVRLRPASELEAAAGPRTDVDSRGSVRPDEAPDRGERQ